MLGAQPTSSATCLRDQLYGGRSFILPLSTLSLAIGVAGIECTFRPFGYGKREAPTILPQGDLPLVVPLLERLLNMPKPEHSLLGRTIARCVTAGAIDDSFLWRYIAGDISEDDVRKFRFDNKLYCQPHEFEDKNEHFLKQRMVQSTTLLDSALETIEQWSQIQSAQYGETRIGYRSGFLHDTSYNDTHSRTDHQHVDGQRILFDSIEAAILDHAKKHSDWWQKHRERLCFNHEDALCYFAVLAFTKSPTPNLDLIGPLLCDRNLLEFELSYELGTLINSAFIYLDSATQDAVMAVIQNLWEEPATDEGECSWVLKGRAEYISAIPCHLRSPEVKAILDAYEKIEGRLIRQPSIGTVSAPFSYEVFLNASDDGVIRLLAHYTGYNRQGFDFDFLVGGEREVSGQLREASSRHPSRFLSLLVTHWNNISVSFRDDIMGGVASYLAHRHGNLQAGSTWVPIEEPDGPTLVKQILDELERHSAHWQLNRSAAKGLEACAHVILDTQNAARIVFLAIGFANLREESTIHGDSVNLLTTGINMTSGNVAEALMVLVNNLHEHGDALPELLPPTLRRFASAEYPAIRVLILRRLPYLQSMNPELGWDLFHRAMQDAEGLWQFAERCLYHAYHDQFEKVAPSLERICREGSKEEMKTWGRISALAALTGHIDFAYLLEELNAREITEAWQGAASVWTHTGNIRQHREQCLAGMECGLNAGSDYAEAVSRHISNIFRENTSPISIPIELIQLCFSVFETDSKDEHHRLFGFDEWLNATSQRDPDTALAATEIYLAYVYCTKPHFYDHDNQLVQLVTRLFTEAEEREESDHGMMLKRVVALQDLLLSLGLNSINDWLKAAERQ